MPAQPNKSLCSDHRISILKKNPSSLQENPGRVLDHQDSEADNFGLCKKRRKRREMATSDLAVRTKKRGSKKKKTEEERERVAESDPLALTCDLLRLAMNWNLRKLREKFRKEKETEIIELPNGIMTISPPSQSKGSSSTVYDVEPEPVAVTKKLPMRPWGSQGLKKWSYFGKSDKPDTQRETATSISEKRSNSIRCTVYKVSQLQPVLKVFNWEELLELLIEAKSEGKNLADVMIHTIECSPDMQYKCNFCGSWIVSLFRVCSNCCYKHCLSCCQQNRWKDLPKEADNIEQNHNDHFAETGCGFCGEGVLIMNLLLPFGFLESVEGGSNSI